MRKIAVVVQALILMAVLSVFNCACNSRSDLDKRITRVEQGLIREYSEPAKMALAERMQYYHVPGVSIAVINDLQIEWAKGYGVLAADKSEPVTTDTLFQVASPGKMVVAAAVLHYVDRGTLELDGDVNQELISWKIPANAYTANEKVSVRRLLSHNAGVTISGFRGYIIGEGIPNFQQILDGEGPANSEPIRVDIVPGSQYRYSGGGYLIIKQLLEDVLDKPFPTVMQETVLQPWGMTASMFVSQLPEEYEAVAARGHFSDGSPIPGGWYIYPEMGSGASMWSTASDLARFLIHLMQAYNGNDNRVLTQEMATEMLTAQVEDRGLGPVLGDDGGDRFYFWHPGANTGYKTVVVAYPKRGQGVVIMTNGENGDALWREILNSVSVEYGWIENNTNLYVTMFVLVISLIVVLLLLRRRQAKSVPV